MDLVQLAWTPWVLPSLAGIVLAVTAMIEIAIGAEREAKLSSTLLLGTMAWWLACSALEMLSVGLPAKVLFEKLGYLAFPFIPGTLLVYGVRFSGWHRWVTPTNTTFLQLPGLVVCLLALTNQSHNLVWGPVVLDTTTFPTSLAKDMGPAFLGFIVYASTCLLLAVVLLLRQLGKAQRLHRRQIRMLLLGIVVLIVAMAVNELRFPSGVRVALEPYAVLVFALIVARNLEVVRSSDIIPVAQAVVVDQLPDAVLVVDPAGAVASWNRAATSLFRELRDAGRRMSVTSLNPQLADGLDLGAGKDGQFDLVIRDCPPEGTRAFAVRSSPIRDALGRTIADVVSISDVTEARLLQREREQRHRYLDALWRALPDAVVVLDHGGTVREWNAGAADLLGHSAAAAAGSELLSLISLDLESRREMLTWLVRASHGETLSGLTVRLRLPEGNLTDLSVSGAPVVVGGRLLALVLVFSDISALLAVERRLRAANDELGARVSARTSELTKANQRLADEVAKLQEAESSLLRRNRELLSLQSAVAATGSSLEVAFVLETVTWEMVDLLGIAGCTVYEWYREKDEIVAVADSAGAVASSDLAARTFSLDARPALRRTLEEQFSQSHVVSDGDCAWTLGEPLPEGSRQTLLPMVFQGQALGLVVLTSQPEGRQLSDREVSLGQLLANQAAVAVEHARLYSRAQREISEREAAETKLLASLNEKDTLLQEIHHRVKNNLQVISSLLSLQSGSVHDEATAQVLQESQHRIRSMALIHERLYRSDNLAHIDFGDYLRNLASYLVRSYRSVAGPVAVGYQIDPVHLSIERAVPCGLIVNELVSNALKYAFPDGEPGRIEIGLARSNGHVHLSVRDDGVGLPEGLEVDQLDSLGLQLVHMLTEQLGGQLEVDTRPGTRFEVTFGV